MTVGSPPSRTATTELVVPRSMPTARAIIGPFPDIRGWISRAERTQLKLSAHSNGAPSADVPDGPFLPDRRGPVAGTDRLTHPHCGRMVRSFTRGRGAPGAGPGPPPAVVRRRPLPARRRGTAAGGVRRDARHILGRPD